MTTAQNAPKFILATNEFGYNLFIADEELTNLPATDELKEALQFSVGFDNPEIKRKYYSAISGYNLDVIYIKKVSELKDMSRRVAEAMVKQHGFYTYNVNGVKHIAIA